MTLQKLNLHVHPEHVGMFYRLVSIYHEDQPYFVDLVDKLTKGNDEYVGAHSKAPAEEDSVVPPKADQKTFFKAVISDCECGTCFNTFKRPSRTPWKPMGGGKFINSQFGMVQISGCPVADYNGPPGYVHVSLEVMKAERGAQLYEQQQAIKIEAENTKLSVEKAKLTVATDKIQKERKIVSQQDADRKAKYQRELGPLQAEESRLTTESDNLYKRVKDETWQDLYNRYVVDGGKSNKEFDEMLDYFGHPQFDHNDCVTYAKLKHKKRMSEYTTTPEHLKLRQQIDEVRNKIKALKTQMYSDCSKDNNTVKKQVGGKLTSSWKTIKGKLHR